MRSYGIGSDKEQVTTNQINNVFEISSFFTWKTSAKMQLVRRGLKTRHSIPTFDDTFPETRCLSNYPQPSHQPHLQSNEQSVAFDQGVDLIQLKFVRNTIHFCRLADFP